jgi:hypothetical protein
VTREEMVEKVARAIYLARRNRQRVALGYESLPDGAECGGGVAYADAVEAARAALSAIDSENGELREALEECVKAIEAFETNHGKAPTKRLHDAALRGRYTLDAALSSPPVEGKK